MPLKWGEGKNVAWKTPRARAWLVVASRRGWPRVADDRDRATRRLAAGLAFDVATGREVVNVEVFNIPFVSPRDQSEEQLGVADAGDRQRPRLRSLRCRRHGGADDRPATILWKARFDYQSQHGAGGSPIVYGDLLIFSCDGSDAAFVIALDKHTGKVKWKTNRGFPADQAYTTPLVIRAADRDQLISVGAFRAAAYDPLTGKEIWRVRYDEGFSNVPRPVFAHGLVFIATGFQQPSLLAVRPDGTGDVTKTHIAWTLKRGAPLTPSPIVVGDELYVVNDGGIATCLDAKTGDVIWQQRLGGTYSASPVFADGRIYFLAEQGVTTVIAPGREFRRLAANTLDGGLLASMAVSGGVFRIYGQIAHLVPTGGAEAPRLQMDDGDTLMIRRRVISSLAMLAITFAAGAA